MAIEATNNHSSMTYAVEVSGYRTDPLTNEELPHTEVYRVLALGPRAAESAGRQLFMGAAGGRRFVSGREAAVHAAAID